MASKPPLRPGSPAPVSGQYPVIGPRGGNTGKEVTAIQGRTLPPTSKPGQTYGTPDGTKNKSGGR